MPNYLPHDSMDAEDDQILAEIGERTMRDVGLDSPTANVADMLDPVAHKRDVWRENHVRGMTDGELRILLLYAKLGRNAFLRHWEAIAPDIEGNAGEHTQ